MLETVCLFVLGLFEVVRAVLFESLINLGFGLLPIVVLEVVVFSSTFLLILCVLVLFDVLRSAMFDIFVNFVCLIVMFECIVNLGFAGGPQGCYVRNSRLSKRSLAGSCVRRDLLQGVVCEETTPCREAFLIVR